jgi:hypothetical protein
MAAMSWASCTLLARLSMAKPVVRAAITSLWSPKMDRAWVASVRAATWMTVGVSSPAILNMFGQHQQQALAGREGGAERAACTAPWRVPAAPGLGLHLDDLG